MVARIITLLLVALFALPAVAKDYVFKDESYGTLKVKVRYVGEPAYAKDQMEILVLCKDRRRIKNLITPTWEVVLPRESICAFVEESIKFNRADSEVTLMFGTSEFAPGPATCSGWTQPFRIKELCSAWSN